MMQVGLVLRFGEQFDPPERSVGWQELRELARLAEDVGFDTLWVDDHFVYDAPPLVQDGAGARGYWDAWMLLAALAAATERVELGPLVTCTGYPQPGAAREDGRYDRRDQRRATDPGPRRGLARARISRVRLSVRPPRQPLRGGADDHRGAVAARARSISRHLLSGARLRVAPARPTSDARPSGSAPAVPACFARWRNTRTGSMRCGTSPPRTLRRGSRTWTRPARQLGASHGLFDVRLERTWPCVGGPAPARQCRPAIRGTPEELAARLYAFGSLGVHHITLSLEPWSMQGVELGGRVIEEIRRLESASK